MMDALTIVSQFGGNFQPCMFDVSLVLVVRTRFVVEGRTIGEFLNKASVQIAHVDSHWDRASLLRTGFVFDDSKERRKVRSGR